MEESEALAVLGKSLPRFRRWIGRNRSLQTALQERDWLEPLGADIKPAPVNRRPASIDPRLTGWLERSQSVLTTELTEVLEQIGRNSPEDDPHPAMLPFGLLGDLSTAALHETVHTKLLAWFLDPSKPHGFGDLLLRALCELSELKEHIHGKELENVAVHPEYEIRRGRIDIVVQGRVVNKPLSLWVEAKTSSDEGNRQLRRYAKSLSAWHKKNGDDSLLAAIFLTPDGRKAKSVGERGASEFHWQPLAYPRLACALWGAARGRPDAPGRALLRLYLASVLRDLGGWPLPMSAAADYEVIDHVRGVL